MKQVIIKTVVLLLLSMITVLCCIFLHRDDDREVFLDDISYIDIDFGDVNEIIKGREELPQASFEVREKIVIKEEGENAEHSVQLELSGTPIQDSLSKKYNNYYEINPQDLKGVIYIPNTNIESLAVVKPSKPLYYLDRNLHGEIDKIGTPYIHPTQSGLSDQVVLIQGHNLKNGKAFSSLKEFTKGNFASENRRAYLYDGINLYKCTLFSVRILDSENETIPLSFRSETKKLDYFQSMYDQSIIKLDQPEQNTRLLILSTCTSIRKQDRIVLWYTIDGIVGE